MKNCPWFSLRSNSSELRFRSVLWGNFWVHLIVNLKKRNNDFASLRSYFLASLAM